MAGQLTIDTLRAGSGVLATQNGMTGIAKAWVKWTGETSPVISSSFNVSSITYLATGRYTVNFTTAMPDNNYILAGSGSFKQPDVDDANTIVVGWTRSSTYSYSTTACSVQFTYYGSVGNFVDPALAGVAFFGS
jgi:hypothetical protein